MNHNMNNNIVSVDVQLMRPTANNRFSGKTALVEFKGLTIFYTKPVGCCTYKSNGQQPNGKSFFTPVPSDSCGH